MRPRLSTLAALAGLMSMPASGSASTVPISTDATDANVGPKRRVWSPAVRRYVLKEGNSAVDNARRDRAEAKRQRKALARRPSAGGRQP